MRRASGRGRVFFWVMLWRELRGRLRQSVVVGLGLAVAVGLVVTVVAVSAGMRLAQSEVLHGLYGVGTDVSVTVEPPKPPAPGSSEASKYALTPGESSQVQDVLGLPPGLGVLPVSSVERVSKVSGVAAAVGGLSLVNTKLVVPALSELDADGRPPASATPVSCTVVGVDVADLRLGPWASVTVVSGRGLAGGDAGADVVVLDSGYASANGFSVGSRVVIAKREFVVVGVVAQPRGGGGGEVYAPLGRVQELAKFQGLESLVGYVNVIYVRVVEGAAVGGVRSRVAGLLPGRR